MILIVGLGNPGDNFKKTRHNIGRKTAEAFCRESGMPSLRYEKKWNAEVSEAKIGKEKVVILLPNTFMNKSGASIIPAARFYKARAKDIFLIHDDADIPLGRSKLSFGKRSAGHKGVESVMRALKTRDFWRFRIGIAGRYDIPADKLVLKKFTPNEDRLVRKMTKRTIAALKETLAESPEHAMNSYNS